MIFKITKIDTFKYFINPFLISFIGTIILIFAYNLYFNNSFSVELEIFLLFMVIPTVIIFSPLILFYFNYYKTDKNVIFTINVDQNEFSYKNGKEIFDFKREDIKKCVFYLSLPTYHKRPIYAHWLDFFYVKIITSQGSVIITCLTCDTIDEYIPEELIEKRCSIISHAFPK